MKHKYKEQRDKVINRNNIECYYFDQNTKCLVSKIKMMNNMVFNYDFVGFNNTPVFILFVNKNFTKWYHIKPLNECSLISMINFSVMVERLMDLGNKKGIDLIKSFKKNNLFKEYYDFVNLNLNQKTKNDVYDHLSSYVKEHKNIFIKLIGHDKTKTTT